MLPFLILSTEAIASFVGILTSTTVAQGAGFVGKMAVSYVAMYLALGGD